MNNLKQPQTKKAALKGDFKQDGSVTVTAPDSTNAPPPQ
jgi:hypothetical protein